RPLPATGALYSTRCGLTQEKDDPALCRGVVTLGGGSNPAPWRRRCGKTIPRYRATFFPGDTPQPSEHQSAARSARGADFLSLASGWGPLMAGKRESKPPAPAAPPAPPPDTQVPRGAATGPALRTDERSRFILYNLLGKERAFYQARRFSLARP